jgi:hypothetical protein
MKPKTPTPKQIAEWLTTPPGEMPVEGEDVRAILERLMTERLDRALEAGFDPEKLEGQPRADYSRLEDRLAKLFVRAMEEAQGKTGKEAFLIGVHAGAGCERIWGSFLAAWEERSHQNTRNRRKRGQGDGKPTAIAAVRAILETLPPDEWPVGWESLVELLTDRGRYASPTTDLPKPRVRKNQQPSKLILRSLKIVADEGVWIIKGTTKTTAAKMVQSWLSREKRRLLK